MKAKQLISYLLAVGVLLTIFSCSSNERIPSNLEGMKKYASDLKKEIRDLEQKLDVVQERIDSIEPVKDKSRVPVTSLVIAKDEFIKNATIQANVEASETAKISSETGGRIVSLNFEEGSYVKKGQYLGKVDLMSVENSIDEVRTALTLAEDAYNRQKTLWDQKIGSEMQYLQAKNNKESLEKKLVTLNTQLSKQNIISPLSGYVLTKYQNAGELTGPGAPIAEVISTGSVKVVADIPENMISSVKKGEMVEVILPALDKTINARVSKISRVINPANRTFEIEINLNNSKGLIKPNLMALVNIVEDRQNNVISLPLAVVQQDVSGSYYVYVVKNGEQGKYAAKTIIEVTENNNGHVIVSSGLSEGDEVVMKGSRIVTDKDLVEIVDPITEE